jgi:glycosyltransferase involved in cell wall biosynthesis
MRHLMDGLIARLVVPLARRLSARRLSLGAPRALWLGAPILTLPLKARATRLLGFKSTSLVFETYYISQGFDLNLRRLANGAAKLGPWAGAIMDRLILVWAMLRFDVLHCFFDRGIMRPVGRFGIRHEELDLLSAAGTRVYAFAYGADVRLRQKTRNLGRWNFCAECPEPGKFCLCDDASGQTRLDAICERITAPVALGDMVPYPKGAKNLHYWPIDLERLQPAAPPRLAGPLRIAHAPNHTHFKGSHYLEAAIARLQAEGHAIEYSKVQGVPNAEVLSLFGEADLVADQFIGGAYGYTALEAMALGKPVLTYVRSASLVEAEAECPLMNVTPDTLEETLRWCLANREALPAIGAAGRSYVTRWHSVGAVAARLGQLYLETGGFPAAVVQRIGCAIADQDAQRAAIAPVAFHHPFGIEAEGCAQLERLAVTHPTRTAPSP